MSARPLLQKLVGGAALAGPVVVAFASGGFFDEGRQLALMAVAGLLALWAVVGPGPLPRDRRVLIALGGLAGYCGWVAISTGWSTRADIAQSDVERAALYLGALTLGATLWQQRKAARLVEPAVALGVFVITAYALAGRLLPGIVELTTGHLSGSRLFQPLTYWNAEGELAAIGFILCARIAGDRTRASATRALAAAAAVPIGTAVYLTFSRGAMVTLIGGLVVLLALAPLWSQLRAIALTVELTALAVATCRALGGVNDLSGGMATRESDGAIALAVLLVLMLVAAAGAAWMHRIEMDERTRLGRLPFPDRAPLIAFVVAVGLIVIPIAAAGSSHLTPQAPRFGDTSQRLSSTGSNRYQYWKVALKTFADDPLSGVGTGGFATEWLQRRTITEVVRDAHSLYIETLAELGLIGLALLALLFGGVAACARAVYRVDPTLAAGPIAALTAYALHAGIDWDWEMPGLTLFALLLASVLLSRAAARSAD